MASSRRPSTGSLKCLLAGGRKIDWLTKYLCSNIHFKLLLLNIVAQLFYFQSFHVEDFISSRWYSNNLYVIYINIIMVKIISVRPHALINFPHKYSIFYSIHYSLATKKMKSSFTQVTRQVPRKIYLETRTTRNTGTTSEIEGQAKSYENIWRKRTQSCHLVRPLSKEFQVQGRITYSNFQSTKKHPNMKIIEE